MAEMSTRTDYENRNTEEHQHSEGVVARTIENQTAKLPSDLFLWASVGSMAGFWRCSV